MDTKKIKTFLTVAKYGSFSQASQHLFMSPVAVMRESQSLENEVNSQLFVRKHSGVKLTTSGKIMEKKGKEILDLVAKTCDEIMNVGNNSTEIKVGTSALLPANNFGWLWTKLKQNFPNFRFNYISIDNKYQNPYLAIGKDIDILIGPYDSKSLGGYESTGASQLESIEISKLKFSIAMMKSNMLSSRSKVSISDLAGQHVWTQPTGISRSFDKLRTSLEEHHLDLHNTQSTYSVDSFNHIKSANDCLLSLNYDWGIRPDIINVPLDTEVSMSLNFIINVNASSSVKKIFNLIPRLI